MNIGIAGTGFIARGFAMALDACEDLTLSRVLTRRPLDACGNDHPTPAKLTNDLDDLIEHSDLIVECSGDVLHATEVVSRAFDASLPVITMNAEFQVTVGSAFVGSGVITEAYGDQPGTLAELNENALDMGFRPLVYGNRKGYYNPDPPRDQMEFWANKQGLSVEQTTSATDGTKLQVEQALVANGLDAELAVEGLVGIESETIDEAGLQLAGYALRAGHPIADYAVVAKAPAGVFIVAEHDERQQAALEYLKLGSGPYYVLIHNFHLCHLEIVKTIRRFMLTGRTVIDNSACPRFSVATVAKHAIARGTHLRRGIGSFDVRGTAVRISERPDHLPIGLLQNAHFTRAIEPGQIITFDDVELPDSLAIRAWQEIRARTPQDTPHDTELAA